MAALAKLERETGGGQASEAGREERDLVVAEDVVKHSARERGERAPRLGGEEHPAGDLAHGAPAEDVGGQELVHGRRREPGEPGENGEDWQAGGAVAGERERQAAEGGESR